MAAEAAKEALASAGVEADQVDAIIVATVTPDYMFPATACLVQSMIAAKHAYGFDLSAACSGFLFALSTGASLVESGRHRNVLVIGADKMSAIVDYTDRNTCILFGDGAGAVLLQRSDDGCGLVDYIHHSDGDTDLLLYQPAGGSFAPANHDTVDGRQHYLRQEGKAVFKRATEGMANVAAEVMERNGLSSEDVDWLVPHQANLRIIDVTANRAGLPPEKVMVNISKYGNTTAATIPLCLYDWKEKLRKGDKLILAAFGGGLTWGAAYLVWGGAR
jgi:3-oxoacyl-[acyl-carrier-protein] synthase-3